MGCAVTDSLDFLPLSYPPPPFLIAMDRLSWAGQTLLPGESVVFQQPSTSLYDGDDKSAFAGGVSCLTDHRFLWKDAGDPLCILGLPLQFVVDTAEAKGGLFVGKSAKVVIHLSPRDSTVGANGPVPSSQADFIKISFRDGGATEFHRHLDEVRRGKKWEQVKAAPKAPQSTKPKARAGIVGIERTRAAKTEEAERDISVAFADLSQLMVKAKQMVTLSKSVSQKIREKQGEISDDETVQFQSHLLSLGVADPVTRESHGGGDSYTLELAKEIATLIEGPLSSAGGTMSLTDVFVRVNRARGMELLSPEDLVNACKVMREFDGVKRKPRLKVALRKFDQSGVMVLQLKTLDEESVIKDTETRLQESGSLSASELAHAVGTSVLLAMERLRLTEEGGKACRDDSVQGLRFYPNYFLFPDASA